MFGSLTAWAKEPFKSDMNAGHWFLFIGLLLVVMASWQLILGHIIRGIE